MKSFLFGLGLGVGLGVLFAPMSGEETRNSLAERANELADNARETWEQGRDRFRTGVEQVKGAVGMRQEEPTRPTGTENI